MKFLYSAILAMVTVALSSPLEEREVQVAHLTFHGGPASYELAVPADGTVVQTSKPYHMSIHSSFDTHTHTHALYIFPLSHPILSPRHHNHIPRYQTASQKANKPTLNPQQTDSDISINLIDAPDYNAQSQCQFHTAGPVTLQGQISADGTQQIAVGPPQPILSVSCLGMCVPTNGVCYNQQGQNVGPCCSGFCAATRCRAWDVNA